MAEWNPRANEIFLQAMEIEPPQKRRDFADQACGEDGQLRAQVESLVQAAERAGGFLERLTTAPPQDALRVGLLAGDSAPLPEPEPGSNAGGSADIGRSAIAQTLASLPLSEGPGTVIGRYRLLEKVGEGGFGAVYVAEQKTPVRRRVALKIIKLGMDTRSVVAGF